MEHLIPITNGRGTKEIVKGNYSVVAEVTGYNNDSINPSSIEIQDDIEEYHLTIAATGTLTLHVSDDGTEIGIPIVGATFIRCDAEGNTYGEEIVSNDDGEAVFNAVPFHADSAPEIYFKQTASDGEHNFDDSLQSTTMDSESGVLEIQNSQAAEKSFTLTDANYENLPIADGNITLN